MAVLTPKQRQIFTDKNFVALATLARDGTPRAIILWVDVDGDDVLVNGTRSRLWLKNLERNPKVALTIFDGAEPYRRVSIDGTVTQVSDEGGDEHYGRLMQKYRGMEAYQARMQQGGPIAAEPRTLVRIRPDRITSRGVD